MGLNWNISTCKCLLDFNLDFQEGFLSFFFFFHSFKRKQLMVTLKVNYLSTTKGTHRRKVLARAGEQGVGG